jgi:YggT family protein
MSALTLIAAITRADIANYVDKLFFVYMVLIFARIVLSWVQQYRPIPYNLTLRAVLGFIEDSVDPYLNFFRKFIPPIGGGGLAIDLSPIVGLIVLLIANNIVVNLIAG